MAGNLTAMIAAIFSGSAVSTDPYFNYTTLLLSTTATNGQQNNTFLDSSTNNFTITRNPATGPNAPTQGTFSPFSQTGWSNYFDGTSDYLTVNDNAALELGSSNFCLEFMYYPTSSANTDFVTKRVNAASYGLIIVQTGLALNFWLSSSGSSWDLFNNAVLGSVTLNAWNHLAIYRIGNAWYSSLNGTITTLSASLSGSVVNNAANWNIGGNNYASGSVIGYLSNFRLVIGSSVYTSTSAPIPTAPLTAVTNTQLLTCQSNRFVDNSTNNFAVTPTGNTTVVPFSPFNPTSAWSASTVGGSGYFDGTGDYLTVANNAAFNFGTGDFTVEFWFYALAPAANSRFLSNAAYNASGIDISWESGSTRIVWYISSTPYVIPLPDRYAWHHVAFTRSGTTLNTYINGARANTYTNSSNITSANVLGIGAESGGTNVTNSYISNLRLVKGTALYTGATYTVPTAPLTAITNTSLLLNFTNSGIYDATAKNVLETVGTAQVSTTQAKFGTTSMYFDGVTTPADYLIPPLLPYTRIGAGDYTLEMWLRPGNVASLQALLSFGSGSFRIFLAGQNPWFLNGASNIFQPGTNTFPTADVWYHFAMVRKGSTGTNCAMWVNGTRISTGYANTTDFSTGTPQIAAESGGSLYQGYMQDFRLTRFARYDPANSTITVPTAAFPVQ